MSDTKKQESELPLDEVMIDFEQIEEVSRVFFQESREVLEGLDELILSLEQNPDSTDKINLLFRKVHTLKGSVGAVPGGQLFGSLAHEFEALLGRIKQEKKIIDKNCIELFLKSSDLLKRLAQSLREKRELYPEDLSEAIEVISSYGKFKFSNTTHTPNLQPASLFSSADSSSESDGVWLSMEQLNEMTRLSGELLVLKNYLHMMNQTVNFKEQPQVYEKRQADFSGNLAKISEQLQSKIQEVRKERVDDSFHGLHLLIRQVSTELDKSVQLTTQGMDLLIDKVLAKDLYEVLVHLVRNSVDHGIEDPFERAVHGKAPQGQLHLEIAEVQGSIHLTFSDDGKGLDKDRILQKAKMNGLVSDDVGELSENEIFNLIFSPGFSTKEKITTISGRGVGMDVVKNTIEKYKGQIHISSQAGQGSKFSLVIPIPQHLMVETGLLGIWQNLQFAIPLTAINHISTCQELQLTYVNQNRFCQFQERTVPLFSYHELLRGEIDADLDLSNCSAIFLKEGTRTLALLVDRIQAQTDMVVKPFGALIGEMKGFKGVSILADEKITYVVSPSKLMDLFFSSLTNEMAEAA